jgi:transposase InsO family protein
MAAATGNAEMTRIGSFANYVVSAIRYLDFYNGRRPHSSLDGTTPDQAYFTPLPLRLAAGIAQSHEPTPR